MSSKPPTGSRTSSSEITISRSSRFPRSRNRLLRSPRSPRSRRLLWRSLRLLPPPVHSFLFTSASEASFGFEPWFSPSSESFWLLFELFELLEFLFPPLRRASRSARRASRSAFAASRFAACRSPIAWTRSGFFIDVASSMPSWPATFFSSGRSIAESSPDSFALAFVVAIYFLLFSSLWLR